MEINEKVEYLIEKILSFSGTEKYYTRDYIGFKVNSKLYLELEPRKTLIRLCVNKKYVTPEEIDKLNITIVPETHGWSLEADIRIPNEETNLDPYLTIIKRAYEETKKEYEEKIKSAIEIAIKSMGSYVKEDMGKEEFAFQKLEDKWTEFKNFQISNNTLDELKSEVESLDRFRSQEILDKYKNDETKYNFIQLINEVVSYVDLNGFNKNIYNKYEDKRTLALTFVRQKDWVRNLISYKKYNDLDKLAEVVRNVIMYINSPESKITGFVNYKLMQFCKLLDPNTRVENNYSALCAKIHKELAKSNIEVKNEKNRGIIYGKIMFEASLVKLWDIETTYLKLQPYKTKGLSREEIDNYLNDNIIVSTDKSLERNTNYNIFYAFDEIKGTMFLGTFSSQAVKDENNIYYRKFIKLYDPVGSIEDMPNNKPWANKRSSRSVIVCNDKIDFESYVLNKVFDLDIDNLLTQIDKMEIKNETIDLQKYNTKVAENKNVEDNEENIEDDNHDKEDFIYEKEIETPLNMILYGPPGTGKTYNTVNYAVSIVEKKEIEEVVEESKTNREDVFSRYKKYLSEKKIVFTTFHQNYSYEEFIQGIRANTNNTDQLSFVKEDGIFKDLVERAKNDPEHYYVMVIDEINRGNISRIFGELITLIEDDKRLNQPNETMVTLPSKEVFGVPSNIFILGTMNTADKSIALIDIALRRRFEFIPMYTDYSLIKEFEQILKPINRAIYEKKRSADYMIGHAFFVNKTMDDLEKIINNKIIPLLNEYFNGREEDIIDVLEKGGIKVIQCFDTFQLYYDGVEN